MLATSNSGSSIREEINELCRLSMPKAPFIISIDGAFFVGETQKTIRRQQRVRKQEEHELDL